jgi:hypothetical protein
MNARIMIRTIQMILFTFVLALMAAPYAAAQTTESVDVMYHWGPLHKGTGQAVVLNLSLTDHFGDPALTVPAEIVVEDNAGNVLFSQKVTLGTDRAIIAVLTTGPEMRTARSTIQGDIYAAVGPEYRLLAPCIKVTFPSGRGREQFFATLEVMDVLTGRTQIFADPHIRAGLGIPQ